MTFSTIKAVSDKSAGRYISTAKTTVVLAHISAKKKIFTSANVTRTNCRSRRIHDYNRIHQVAPVGASHLTHGSLSLHESASERHLDRFLN